MLAYDDRVGKWEKLRSNWHHRIKDKCCCHKGKIYVSSCSRTCDECGYFDEVGDIYLSVYDPVADQWESHQSSDLVCNGMII